MTSATRNHIEIVRVCAVTVVASFLRKMVAVC
jgi:hypothetical protein